MKISILSCGWLGLPLGISLVKNGYEVKGATTTESKKEILSGHGIQPFLLKLTPEIECENFSKLIDSELIIINIPPRVSQMGDTFHLQQIKNLIQAFQENFQEKKKPKIIFTSSTSVYQNTNQDTTEQSIIDENHVLIKAENLLKENFEHLTILRLGGLMGFDRFPGKYYQNKLVENWASKVNYIHQTDAIQIITKIIERNIWGETFNVCSPEHPTRREVIIKNCIDLGLMPAQFSAQPLPEHYKIIQPQKLISTLNYQFIFPNPLDFFYQKEK